MRFYTLIVSMIAHIGVIGAVIVAPLMAFGVLLTPQRHDYCLSVMPAIRGAAVRRALSSTCPPISYARARGERRESDEAVRKRTNPSSQRSTAPFTPKTTTDEVEVGG